MKKGLNVTLMTVACAMLCLQAMASAPVISDIPSPIVGSVANATAATPYVFSNAIDLDARVSDDTTADANILWSYTYTGSAIYRINNVDPISVGTDNINAPGAKRLNGSTLDPADGDSKSSTISIRNVKYRPISGTGATPSYSGIGDSQVVTLFASDGTTYSMKSALFYTDVGGTSRLSTGGGTTKPTPVPVTPPAIPSGWTYQFVVGTVTSGTSGGQAICLDVPAAGDNFAGWNSNFGVVQLVDNAVYNFRFRVNGSQASAGSVPFWDIVLDNYTDNGSQGLNLFGGDFYVLDNEGGANASYNKPSTSGTTYQFWWCPTAITTAAWRNTTTGPFATSVGANRDIRLKFRVLDVVANAGITAQNDSGSICVNQILIDRYDITNLSTVGSAAYTNTNLAAGNFQAQALLGSTVTYASGVCTIAQTSASKNAEYIQCYPGDATLDFGNASSLADNYPVPWTSGKLYMVTVDIAAADSSSETNPFDVYWVAMDTCTNEIISESFSTGNLNFCAMPKTGTAQTFRSFYYSHNETLSSVAGYHRLRPRLNIGNNTGLNWGANTGSWRVSKMQVDQVTFQ